MAKAKTCDEMLQFEKVDALYSENNWPVWAHSLVNVDSVTEFEETIAKFIKDAQSGAASNPLNLAGQTDLG